MPHTIIHVDLDAFYCSVEEQRDPSLRGRAFVVGGRPDQRGVVASCSYAARQFGVHSAMPMARALQLCPNLVGLPTDHAAYRAASAKVMAMLRSVTPLLEQLSIDEAFLDASGLTPDGPHSPAARALAERLQNTMLHDIGLSCSIGVAANKIVAKIATDYGKAAKKTGQSPRAIWVVAAGAEADFLEPLPVSTLWGVGPKTAGVLVELGISTIGQLARCPQQELMARFGRNGYEMSQHARGIDRREVVTVRESKSISCETTFPRDLRQWAQVQQALARQAESITQQLARHNLRAATVKLKVRWADFSTVTRQSTLLQPTDQQTVVLDFASHLLHQLWQPPRPIRLLGVGASGLHRLRQLPLWPDQLPSLSNHPGTPKAPRSPSQSPSTDVLNEQQSLVLEGDLT